MPSGLPGEGHTVLKFIYQLFPFLYLAAIRVAAEQTPGEFPSESLQVGNVVREYRLVVPTSLDLSQPAPLVIAFHGMLIDSKDVMPWYTRLNRTAAAHKFLLVYPNAIGRSWGIAPDKVQSDLAFFDALLQQLTSTYKIDTDRVYVLGMSNGGYFAHVVGKERSTTVAAVASHSGPLGLQTLFGIRAERKFPVMIIHGDQDQLFSPAIFRENRDKYQREGHAVQYVELPGVGHVWGAEAKINETIWKFFSDHPRDQEATAGHKADSR
jgi:polyhydroxybutyrate depolymerase